MTVHPEAPTGFDGLRELPLNTLYVELDRLEHLIAQRSAGPHDVGRDLATSALRQRERAVVSEIRRRPGVRRGSPGPLPLSAGVPRA